MRTRLVLSIVAGVLSLAVASPAVAAAPTIEDRTVTVTGEDALAAYEEFGDVFQDCGDFVVLAAFTAEDRVITFEDRENRCSCDVCPVGSYQTYVRSHWRDRDCYDDWARAVT